MAKIRLSNLKDCFRFFEWLKNDHRMQSSVAKELPSRYGDYYNRVSVTGHLPVPFIEFLTSVSTFYHKIANNPEADQYTGKSSQEVTDVLFDCIPKFLAALYYLWYNVDVSFEAVGGGKWRYDYPGYEKEWAWFGKDYGGSLQEYLRMTFSVQNHGLLTGGFGPGEVTYGYRYPNNGYKYGESMISDLKNILNKQNDQLFRDVFSTSVVSKFGTQDSNTANVLALVKTFCDIVENDKDNKMQKSLEEEAKGRDKCLQWNELKRHCATLHSELNKIFKSAGFSYTGGSPGVDTLNTEKFAEKAAKWFRENLENVRNNVSKINKNMPVDDTTYLNVLQKFATGNIFPYGFIFGDQSYGTLGDAFKRLTHHWSGVLHMLVARNDGLDKLKTLLEGGACKAPPPPTIQAAQPVAANPARPSQPPGSEGTNVSGAKDARGQQNQVHHVILSGTKAQGSGGNSQRPHNQSQGAQQRSSHVSSATKTEATKTIASKSEASANQGKKTEGTSGPSHSQSGDASAGSPVAEAVQTQDTGATNSQSGPSGDSVSSSGQDAGGPRSNSGSGQLNDQKDQQNGVPSTTASTGTRPGSGADAGGSGAGGSGSPKLQLPPPPKCKDSKFSTLWTTPDDYCAPQQNKSKPAPFKFKDPDALRKIYEKVKNSSQITHPNLDPQSVNIQQNYTVNPNSGHTSQSDIHHPDPRLSPTTALGSDLYLSGGEVEDNIAFSNIRNDEYSNDIEIEGHEEVDVSTDYHQLLDEQKRQEAQDQLEQYYSEQYRREIANDERKWKDAYVNFVSSVNGGHIEHTYNAAALEGNIMPEFSGLISHNDTLHDQSLADYDNRMARRNQKLNELGAIHEHENRIITAMQDDHERIVADALAAISDSKLQEQKYYEALSNPLTGAPVSGESASSIKSANHYIQPPMGDVAGLAIPDPELTSSSIPTADLDPPPPPPPISIDVNDFNSQDNVLKSEITRTNPAPIIYPIDPASPYDTYPGLPPVWPTPNLNSDSDIDYNHPTKWGNFKNYGFTMDPNPNMCNNPWNYIHNSTTSPTILPYPKSDHLLPPKTVREMLFWLVGFNTYGLIAKMERHIEGMLMVFNGDTFYPKYALQVNGDLSSLPASHIADTLTEACLYAAHVLNGIMRVKSSEALSDTDFKSEYSQLRYSTDPAGLLCQLLDYVYACHHQLQFLKAQCNRDKLSGGWQNHDYGNVVSSSASPLQAFLTDGWDSDFETHPFDPCNLCHKSRVRMGFRKEDLPSTQQTGTTLATILSPSCGGSDPLLTLSSYLNCLTRRTPRTTGELVSYFHHFGMELHNYASKSLSPLGTAITKSHLDCPDWDCLGAADLQAVKGIRGSESLIFKQNLSHDNVHPRTLSTLVGCGSDSSNCPSHCSPITYRAYALYSQRFAHTYLSWVVYLPDRLWESLLKLYYDLQKHVSIKCTSLYSCPDALPLLYLHGFTPPEVESQPKLTCKQVTEKLKEIVDGKPIASLMTAMDNILYGIREPFIFSLVALWSLAFLIFANTMLYRIDILHIRSHLIRTKASHLIDVKALLTKGRKMLSLYKDVDYFDDDPIGQLVIR